MDPKLNQLFAHFQTRDAEPARGFGLIALGQLDGLSEQFGFKIGGLALAMHVSVAATDSERTITGDGACAKCVLKETKECQATIIADEGGKKVTYHLTQNSIAKEFGNQLCAEKKRVKAMGTVKTADGKQTMTPTKI